MKHLQIKNVNYRILNKDTKHAKKWLDLYNNSYDYSIFNVYTRPSYAKEEIENEIKAFINENNGRGYKILTHCVMTFSVGYIIGDYLLVETRDSAYAIKLN